METKFSVGDVVRWSAVDRNILGEIVNVRTIYSRPVYTVNTYDTFKQPTAQDDGRHYVARDGEIEHVRGLHVGILEAKDIGNCSAGGISSRCESVTLVGDGIDEIFDADAEAPAVVLRKRVIGGEVVVNAEPLKPRPAGNVGYMAGGTFIHTSDSRFGEALRKLGHSGYCAISLHDRSETQEQYNQLST
jgi:hypothetical protein